VKYPKRIDIEGAVMDATVKARCLAGDKLSPEVFLRLFSREMAKFIANNYRRRRKGVAACLLACLMAGGAWADDAVVKERMVNAIIGEAEGESQQGKLAVACAIINRTALFGSFDKAMRGVYGERSPRVLQRKYSGTTFVNAVRAYEDALNVGTCDFIDGATHWEGTAFKKPYWADKMTETATVGNQVFYK
jgi:hypothetical protein